MAQYDYIITEFELTEEEQDKAKAAKELLRRKNPVLSGGSHMTGLYEQIKQGALQIFQQQLIEEIMQRIGGSKRLVGSWTLSLDGKKLLVCQVRQIL